MFQAIKNWAQQRSVAKELGKLPAIQIARIAIQDSWSSNKAITQDFSRELIDGQATLMMQKVIEIASSDTPWLANRGFLAECVIEYAQFGVLVLEPPPAEDTTGFRGMPGITGELKQHYMMLAAKDEGLREALRELPHGNDPDEIWNFIVFRNRQLWAWGNVFQSVRFAYNDHAPKGEEDWYRPFVAAMFAWQEDTYRKALGLPSALEGECEGVHLRALWYSTFMNRVTNGDANPLATWREDLAEYEKAE
ncbi:hypothetical protein [Pseudoxanthomonas koreensis]|uniref:hypothetical protein n=1 Tax=Pseudoxanthomonas koreensis TaxID=266061 RepID=UPI0013909D2F|nr:hypothetical protein [Pseudoxanthomonas koreensis]